MSSTTKVRTSELMGKKKDELLKQLDELKRELVSLRVQKVAGGNSSKLMRIGTTRKSIAKVLTVITAKTRDSLREHYAGKKHLPLDLRAKKTRALRRKLSRHERTQKTTRQAKGDVHFARKKYAVKA